jgi:site-specific recombinase XerD
MARRKPLRRFPPEVLNDAEVRALLHACGDRTLPERRNRALLVLLYRSGLRISEALMLHPKDIDLDSGTVRVLFAKGGRSRTVGIDRR